MRWPWQRHDPPSFERVVECSVGTAINIVCFALENETPPRPPRSAWVIAYVARADGQVCNGRFSQLLYNDGGHAKLERYRDALATIGADAAASLFDEVIALCAREAVSVERLCRGDYFGDPLTKLFDDELAGRYHALSRQVRHRYIDYMLARDEPWFDAATAVAERKEGRFDLDARRALDSALTYAHSTLLRRAIDAGVDLAGYRGIDGETALHRALHYHAKDGVTFLPTLLEAGAPVDVPDHRGQRPLHRAAGLSGEATRLLLARGAAADAPDEAGTTPLHGACEDATALLLAAGADPRARSKAGFEPLHDAGSVAIVDLLVAAGADPRARSKTGIEPMHRAGNVAIVDALLSAGADARTVDADGRTVLHHMASRCHEPAVLRRVIAAGADARARDTRGLTPLHEASSPAVVEILCEAGADLDACDDRGRTPLMTTNRAEVVAALLARGARVESVDHERRTVLHYPRWNRELVATFIAAGARLDARDAAGRTPLEHARVAYTKTEAAKERTRDLPYGEDDYKWAGKLADDAMYCEREWVEALEAATASAQRMTGRN